jgi:hypothetical protein
VGASSTTGYTVTMPVIAKNIANYVQWATLSRTYNNSAEEAAGSVQTTPNSNSLYLARSAQAAWTAAGNKLAAFQIDVEY